MKKILAVFMAVLTVFSAFSVVVYASDIDTPEETTTAVRYPEAEPSTGIVDEDGLVVPENPTQLGMAFIFKIVEKIVSFFEKAIDSFFGLFRKGSDIDGSISSSIDDAGKWLDEALSNIFGSLDD